MCIHYLESFFCFFVFVFVLFPADVSVISILFPSGPIGIVNLLVAKARGASQVVITGRHITQLTLQASFSGTLAPHSAVNGYASEEALTVSVHPSTKVTHISLAL